MAGHTIQAPDDQSIELCPTGAAEQQPPLEVRSQASEGGVTVYLAEERRLMDALAEAAAERVRVCCWPARKEVTLARTIQ